MGGAILGPRGGYQKCNFRLLFRDFGRLESGADGEVEGSAGFAVVAGEGAAVFEADGADGEVDADSEAGGEFKIVIEGSGVEEDKAFEGTFEGAGVFSVGDPPAVAAEGGAIELWAHLAFGEGADGVGSAEEFAKVDGEFIFLRAGIDETATESESVGGAFAEGVVVTELGVSLEVADVGVSVDESENGVEAGEPAIGGQGGVVPAVVFLAEAEAVVEVVGRADKFVGEGAGDGVN